jgi:hypothetical protein
MVATSDGGLITYGIEDLWLPRRQGSREVGLYSRLHGNIEEIGDDMRESVGMAQWLVLMLR